MRHSRRARSRALQALYAYELRGGEPNRGVQFLHDIFSDGGPPPEDRLFANVLVRLVAEHQAQIDELLQHHLSNWRLPRLSAVDRNLLRLGAAEILFLPDIAPRDTMRALMRLADRYGTPESARFLHGVLDAVARAPREQAAPGAR